MCCFDCEGRSATILMLTSLDAAYVPFWKAAHVDPAITLRDERSASLRFQLGISCRLGKRCLVRPAMDNKAVLARLNSVESDPPHEHFVQVPFITCPGTPSSQAGSELPTKLGTPAPDSFVADQHSSISHHFFHIPKFATDVLCAVACLGYQQKAWRRQRQHRKAAIVKPTPLRG
jgi:hypothetical protein